MRNVSSEEKGLVNLFCNILSLNEVESLKDQYMIIKLEINAILKNEAFLIFCLFAPLTWSMVNTILNNHVGISILSFILIYMIGEYNVINQEIYARKNVNAKQILQLIRNLNNDKRMKIMQDMFNKK